MGILGFLGDQYYLKGLKQNSLEDIKFAATIFPFNKDILTGEAEIYLKNQIVNLKAYEAIKQAVVYDPYSARLLSLQMQYAFIMNDNFNGYVAYSKLKYLFPNAPIVKEMLKH